MRTGRLTSNQELMELSIKQNHIEECINTCTPNCNALEKTLHLFGPYFVLLTAESGKIMHGIEIEIIHDELLLISYIL